jgi:sRNA-binding protein
MSLAGRLREAAASGAAVMDLNGDDMAGASHDEKILRQLRHDERELSEQVAQMRAELKRRREDAPTRKKKKKKKKKNSQKKKKKLLFSSPKAMRRSERWPTPH